MPELPTTFGKYFLTEKLATGGMAEIYLAKIMGPGGFEKQLVIKQIHPKLSGQRHFVDLFVAEAKTLVSLAHGNIVPVYELGVVDDTYFIAMEYIDGPTLYRLTETLARRDVRMEPAVAAWITARIVEGLDYAHRKGEGVIHRDLSPRNVMLSRDGEVKLVDFGIAVTLGDAVDDESAQSAPTGSFPYMSPEQVRKEQLTNQTDLFSVGVLFWEMLVGHRLFARNDPDATLRAVTEAEIARPSTERPEVPAKLDDIVLRALERDRTARWADASEMLGALNKYLYALEDTPGPRDVGALVARFCPPETRRMPTHADPLVLEDLVPGVDATKPRAEDTQAGTPPPLGPMTAVIPRPNPRPGTTRNEVFATHVQLKDILERGTPALGLEAIVDDEKPATNGTRRAESEGPTTTALSRPPVRRSAEDLEDDALRRARSSDDDDDDDDDRPADRRSRRLRDSDDNNDDSRPRRALSSDDAGERPRRARTAPRDDGPDSTMRIRATSTAGRELSQPPSNRALVIAGLGGFVALAIAIWMFLRNRESVLTPDAAPGMDAPPFYLADVNMTDYDAQPAATDATIDATPIDATPIDAAPTDGPLPPPLDARPPLRDAAPLDAPDKPDAAQPIGKATLVIAIIGDAIPWAEVYIDGKKAARTAPGEFEISSGKHTIELVYPESDPPKRVSFKIDPAPDARVTKSFDLSKP